MTKTNNKTAVRAIYAFIVVIGLFAATSAVSAAPASAETVVADTGSGTPANAIPVSQSDSRGGLFQSVQGHALLATAIYALIGAAIFGLCFLVFSTIMPFSVRHEIEKDQNTALGVIIGAFLIGLAIIIAAAIH